MLLELDRYGLGQIGTVNRPYDMELHRKQPTRHEINLDEIGEAWNINHVKPESTRSDQIRNQQDRKRPDMDRI